MHTFLKVFCVLTWGVAGITAAAAWSFGDRLLGVVATSVAAMAFIGFWGLHFRRDLAPDFLKQRYGQYFERNGFCFCVFVDSRDGIAFLKVPFQNRFAKPSIVQIALRQGGSRVPFFEAGKRPFLMVEIQCGAGAFGVADFPVAIPSRHQGKSATFEIGVSVHYPEGKGTMLRFRDGNPVPHDAQFRSFSLVMGAIVTMLTRHMAHASSAAITQILPSNVVERLPEHATSRTEVLWSLPENAAADALGYEIAQKGSEAI